MLDVLCAVACDARPLRAPHANHVSRTDEKRIRAGNTVTDNSKDSLGFLHKIVDCLRMCFLSAGNQRSARTGRRPRKIDHQIPKYLPALVRSGDLTLRATRANRGFCTDKKRIRTEITVMDKSKGNLGLV